jgi:hypothetical protein
MKTIKGCKGIKGIKGIPLIKIKHKIYLHHIFQIGIFRFSFYILGSKFSIRLEIAKGWEN